MRLQRTIKAFFSYAQEDAIADPRLVESLTSELEQRVKIRLPNDGFEIWRDKKGIRTGDMWNAKIESELQTSDILIALLTPKWLGSNNCVKEFIIFEEIEAARSVGDYVAGYICPILGRKVRVDDLTDAQKDIYLRLTRRQYFKALAADFLRLGRPERIALLDKIAEDIEGMILRRRAMQTALLGNTLASPLRVAPSSKKTFHASAQNFERVDFVTNGVVLVESGPTNDKRSIFAQVDFIERLYIQGESGRIEFGVRRAILSIINNGIGVLSKLDNLRGKFKGHNISYVTLHAAPDAISISIDPVDGKSTLTELSLPPALNQNYLSIVAIASNNVKVDNITADLVVSLNVEGLHVAGDEESLSLDVQNKIKAIMQVAATKIAGSRNKSLMQSGELRRPLPVGEQK